MEIVRSDGTAALLREREAKSLTLLCGIVLVGFFVEAATVVGTYFTNPQTKIYTSTVLVYFGLSIVVTSAAMLLLRKRRWTEGIGVFVAVNGALTSAAAGYIMWSTFAPTVPLSVLAKLPIAPIGLGTIAVVTLTLRPLHVVIVGLGVAMTLIGFFAVAAQDPATTFAWYSAEPLLGPAISPTRLILELLSVGIATAGAAIATSFARRTIREAVSLQRSTDQLSRYFSPDVAAGIRDGGEAFQRLGGREQDVVVLFSDLAGFTHACAGLQPAEALALLSEYQERMVTEIFRAGGTLDKFMGDGIMATFGTPSPAADATDRAVHAARGMIAALAGLNEERAMRGEKPLVQRIGIHGGPVLVGNVGTHQRLEFTVIGDAVNVASRIENACKKTGKTAMLSAAVVAQLREAVALEPIGPVALDGQPEAIELYALA